MESKSQYVLVLTECEMADFDGQTFLFPDAPGCADAVVAAVKKFADKWFVGEQFDGTKSRWGITPEWFMFRYEDGLVDPKPGGDGEPLWPEVVALLKRGRAVSMELGQRHHGYGSSLIIHAQLMPPEKP